MTRVPTTYPVPARITAALDATEAEGPDVDRVLGVAGPDGEDLGVVDKWETGELIPTAAQLHRLAEATHYPPAFFFFPPAPLADVYACAVDPGHGGACEHIAPSPPILAPLPGATTSTGEPPATLRSVEALAVRPISFSRPLSAATRDRRARSTRTGKRT